MITSNITSDIKNIDDLRNFYQNHLKKIFDNLRDEDEKKKILVNIPKKELVRLFSIISNISLGNNTTKKEIVEHFKILF